MPDATWYSALREAYRPTHVRLLLVGESAPDAGTGDRRFFYARVLDRRDNLFRGTVEALFGERPGHAGASKVPWLERLKAAGVWLVDLVPFAVDKLAAGARARARRAHVSSCVANIREIEPEGIVVCHAPTFAALAKPLRDVRLPLLHDAPIPFPLGNHRAEFVAKVRAAIAPTTVLAGA